MTHAMTDSGLMPPTLARLVQATNDHDLEALVGCFAADYVLVMPNHPSRDFTGTEQVRRNWMQLFSAVPDITVTVSRVGRDVSDPDGWWSEWEMQGTRRDGRPHLMRGVMIFTVGAGPADLIRANRFYVEPTRPGSEQDNDVFIAELTGSRLPS
jgi:ketosteroid isomerase-like protein